MVKLYHLLQLKHNIDPNFNLHPTPNPLLPSRNPLVHWNGAKNPKNIYESLTTGKACASCSWRKKKKENMFVGGGGHVAPSTVGQIRRGCERGGLSKIKLDMKNSLQRSKEGIDLWGCSFFTKAKGQNDWLTSYHLETSALLTTVVHTRPDAHALSPAHLQHKLWLLTATHSTHWLLFTSTSSSAF